MKCIVCGEPAANGNGRGKYCGQRCKNAAAHHKRAGKAGPVPIPSPLPLASRTCPTCGEDMSTRRPHATYCSRKCKTIRSDLRRIEDGRSLVRDRGRYATERATRIASSARWAREHPAERRLIIQRRRARKASASCPAGVTIRDWNRLVARYQSCCAYCHQPCVPTMDHVVPLARGGGHSIGNMLPACSRCNSSKNDRLLIDWRVNRLPALMAA